MPVIESTEQYINIQSNQIFLKRFLPEEGYIFACAVNKAAIILLHESLGSVALWKQFPQALANATGREVIAYDRMGFGLSSMHCGDLAADFVWAEAKGDFAAVVETYDLERFIVLGHSVGGGMALSVAAHYPIQCQAVVAISAQAKVEQLTLDGIEAAKHQFKDQKLFQRLAKYHGEKTQWVLDAWTETWLAPDFSSWDLTAVLNQVYCPVQVIHGAADEYATQAQPEQIAAQVRGQVELYILEDCGHFPHQEKMTDVIQLVQKFVADLA